MSWLAAFARPILNCIRDIWNYLNKARKEKKEFLYLKELLPEIMSIIIEEYKKNHALCYISYTHLFPEVQDIEVIHCNRKFRKQKTTSQKQTIGYVPAIIINGKTIKYKNGVNIDEHFQLLKIHEYLIENKSTKLYNEKDFQFSSKLINLLRKYT